ncbi:MAG: bifunctional riboflavin kinase/FMN adenylyltransferase, partial [Chloroflexi bacterium]|nr:bifunctional riboflavin kinase/FMN adenylyltransferase [Chloroflexota bacterium]
LREMGRERGFAVTVAEPWESEGLIVSSTRVRELVRVGDVAHAARLLSRPLEISGLVVSGAQRGRTLGFPTANLDIDPQLLLPADGVYAVVAHVDNRAYPAVCNIGRRPSFDNAPRTFEVHLLDFQGDLYGKTVTVKLVERLRGEVRFPNVAALVSQIRADVTQARLILGEVSVAPHRGVMEHP